MPRGIRVWLYEIMMERSKVVDASWISTDWWGHVRCKATARNIREYKSFIVWIVSRTDKHDMLLLNKTNVA